MGLHRVRKPRLSMEVRVPFLSVHYFSANLPSNSKYFYLAHHDGQKNVPLYVRSFAIKLVNHYKLCLPLQTQNKMDPSPSKGIDSQNAARCVHDHSNRLALLNQYL